MGAWPISRPPGMSPGPVLGLDLSDGQGLGRRFHGSIVFSCGLSCKLIWTGLLGVLEK